MERSIPVDVTSALSAHLQKTAKIAPVSTFEPWPSFYRAMHFSAKRGIAIACRLSVCLSVRLSVCDVGGL